MRGGEERADGERIKWRKRRHELWSRWSAVDVVGKELMCADVMCVVGKPVSPSLPNPPAGPLVPARPRPSPAIPLPPIRRPFQPPLFLSPQLAQCSPQSFPALYAFFHICMSCSHFPLSFPLLPLLSFVSRARSCATSSDDSVSRDSSSDLLLFPFHRLQLVLSSRVSAFWPAN